MQQQAVTSPRSSGNPDLAAWALVALVVVVGAGIAGYLVSGIDSPRGDDLARQSALATQEGAARGRASGFPEGVKQGRSELEASVKLQEKSAGHEAYQEGYEAGVQAGRTTAAVKAGDVGPDALGAYPASGYEDVLAAGSSVPYADVPGYSSSAYGDYGYGVGATSATPYYPAAGTGYGDEDLGY